MPSKHGYQVYHDCDIGIKYQVYIRKLKNASKIIDAYTRVIEIHVVISMYVKY